MYTSLIRVVITLFHNLKCSIPWLAQKKRFELRYSTSYLLRENVKNISLFRMVHVCEFLPGPEESCRYCAIGGAWISKCTQLWAGVRVSAREKVGVRHSWKYSVQFVTCRTNIGQVQDLTPLIRVWCFYCAYESTCAVFSRLKELMSAGKSLIINPILSLCPVKYAHLARLPGPDPMFKGLNPAFSVGAVDDNCLILEI